VHQLAVAPRIVGREVLDELLERAAGESGADRPSVEITPP
jgi:hypothetical protein